MNEKSRQNAENKQTLDLLGKIEIDEKSRQNTENKQTFDLRGKIELEGKSRQISENKQTIPFSVSCPRRIDRTSSSQRAKCPADY